MSKKDDKGVENKAFEGENYFRALYEGETKYQVGNAIDNNNRIVVGKFCKNHPELVNSWNHSGNTFLEKAIRRNYPEIVKELFKHGADANRQNEQGEPPLVTLSENYDMHYSKFSYNKQSLNALYAGFDKFPESYRDLHFKNRNKITELLIKNGADVNFMDSSGKTVLYKAAERVDAKLVKYLLSNGAKIKVEGGRDILGLIDWKYEWLKDRFEGDKDRLKGYDRTISGVREISGGNYKLRMQREKELRDCREIKDRLKVAAALEGMGKEVRQVVARVKKAFSPDSASTSQMPGSSKVEKEQKGASR